MAADRTVKVTLTADASAFVNAVNSAKTSLGQLANTDVGKVGSGMRSTGAAADEMSKKSDSAFSKMKSSMASQVSVGNLMAMGATAAFGAVAGAIGSVVSAGTTYQTTLYTLQAVTHATGAQMADVSAKARELGKDISLPGTSATDAAQAMTELAKGGMSVAQSMTAAKGTLELAAAAQISAGQAAEIQVNALNAFGLAAGDAMHVADSLANVSNQASGDITDFGFGLTAAGATAHSFGMSIDQTNTVLGLFSNAGIKGEEGGTLLKTMLVKLAAPTKQASEAMKTLGLNVYDSQGNFVGMKSVTEQLATAHSHLTTQAYNSNTAIVFGTRGIKGAAILGSEAATAYDTMSTAIGHQGGAAELAAAKMKGLGGAFQNLENQVQDAQLAVFDKVAPALTDLTNKFAAVLPDILNGAMGAVTAIVNQGIDLLSPLTDGIQSLFTSANTSSALQSLGNDLKGLAGGLLAATDALKPIFSLLGGAVKLFSDLPAPIQAAAGALGAMALLHSPLSSMISGVIGKLVELSGSFDATAARVVAAGGVMRFSMTAVADTAKAMWAAMGGWIGIGVAAIVTAFSLFSGGSNDAAAAVTDLSDAVDKNTGKLVANAQQVVANKLGTDGTLQAYKDIGGSVLDYTAALAGNAPAMDRVHTQILNTATAAVQGSEGWDKYGAGIVAAGGSARKTASDILAGGDAASYQTDHLTGLDTGLNAVITSSNNLAGSQGNIASSQNSATTAIAAGGQAANGAAGSAGNLAKANDALVAQSQAGVDATTAQSDALKALKSAETDATTAGDFLYMQLTEMAGGQVSVEQATRAEAAAIRGITSASNDQGDALQAVKDKTAALTAAEAKYGAGSSEVAQATRDLAGAKGKVADASDKQFEADQKAAQGVTQLAGSQSALARSSGDVVGAAKIEAKVIAQGRAEFIKAHEAIGMTAEAANALADKFGLIPRNVNTAVGVTGIDIAKAQVADLNAKLDALNNKTVRFTAIGTTAYQYQTAGPSNANVAGHVAGHAVGGFITGPGGPKDDSIPVRLSNGEFVVNAGQTAKHRSLLDAINNGVAGFAAGGAVQFASAMSSNEIAYQTRFDQHSGGGNLTAADAVTAGQQLIKTLVEIAGKWTADMTAARTAAADLRATGKGTRDVAAAQANVADKQSTVGWMTQYMGQVVNGQFVTPQMLAAAKRDLADAQDAVAAAGDTEFAANVKVADSARAMAAAAYTAKAAHGGLAEASKAATAVMLQQRDAFIKTEIAAGSTAAAAKTLADHLGLVPQLVPKATGEMAATAAEVHKEQLAKAAEALRVKQEAAKTKAVKAAEAAAAAAEKRREAAIKAAEAAAAAAIKRGEKVAAQLAYLQEKTAELNKGLLMMHNHTFKYVLEGTHIIKEWYAPVPIKPPVAPKKKAAGGLVSGPGGPRDDMVPAWLSNHEFVMNAASTAQYLPLLTAMNAHKFAAGGLVGAPAPAAPTAAAAAPLAAAPSMVPDAKSIDTAWVALSAAIVAAWTTQILPTFNLLDLRTIQIGDEFTYLSEKQATPLWLQIGTTISNAWAGVIGPTYAQIDAGTAGIGNQWLWLSATSAPRNWNAINAKISASWVGSIAPTYGALNAGTAGVGSAWQRLAGTAASTWGQIGASITGAYTGHIVPAWSGVKGFAGSAGAFFSSIASGMNTADTTAVQDLAKITTALDTFFKMVAGKVPAGSTTPTIPKKADGGLISAGTGPRSDDVHIMASRGEYVVNAASTAKHKDTLDRINYGGKYADGGLVGDKVNNAVTGNMQNAIEAGVTGMLATIAATASGYVVGGVAGSRGRFLDAVASKMGTQYVWGAAGPNVFDCSGLMSWGLEQAGAGKGRLTAQDFNAGFPHIPASAVVPGDLVTFDTGRIPGQAGHIGAVMDVSRHLMMNTDGSGPAAIADYQNRDGGPLSFIDPIGGAYVPSGAASTGKPGDPPSAGWLAGILAQIKAGGTGAAASSGNTGSNANTSGTEQWRADVVKALTLEGQPVSLANVVLNQMRTESSGNPNAINLTDSNAQKGTPSKGLLQVIDPTFATFHDPKIPGGVWDPLANIAAAIRYVISQYGGVAAGMQGHAYASGGIIPGAPSGSDTVPAWLSPGEAVISRQGGSEAANKGYLGTAASWFGGQVMYPNDAKAMPPSMRGMGAITVQAPHVEVRFYGDAAEFNGRVETMVDGRLTTVTNAINRKSGQSG